MTTDTPPAGFIRPVVGYDGSAPAIRALDAAVRLLQGRTGRIDVVYVAHLSTLEMMSADTIAEIENDFDEIERELRPGRRTAARPRGRLGVRTAPGRHRRPADPEGNEFCVRAVPDATG